MTAPRCRAGWPGPPSARWAVREPQVGLDRLLQYRQELPVDEVEAVDDGQYDQGVIRRSPACIGVAGLCRSTFRGIRDRLLILPAVVLILGCGIRLPNCAGLANIPVQPGAATASRT